MNSNNRSTIQSLSRRKASSSTLSSKLTLRQLLTFLVVFLSGCFFSSTIILLTYPKEGPTTVNAVVGGTTSTSQLLHLPATFAQDDHNAVSTSSSSSSSNSILYGKRILIAIASFDFSQFPLLEEVLDSYQNLCFAGASQVHIYIHTTVPYTVALIDLLNTRYNCQSLQIFIVVKTPALRLNLVDCHRTLFYEKIDEYDVFIYSEDDILVTPTTVATYLQETAKVEKVVSKSPAEDYNIGIVRYEYNYPPDIIINDKTRHATENVTRVYWEHLWKPLVPKSVHTPDDIVNPKDEPLISKYYVTMDNAHQGMFLATPQLLQAWKSRTNCQFDVIRQRPGKKNQPSQPIEGTQRVWMSSRMLHGKKHCNVKQLMPIENFNQLSVWHLPNKNYRRVGKKGRIGGTESSIENEFGTGKEEFVGPDASLPTAMQLHLAMRKEYGYPQIPHDENKNQRPNEYIGIVMLNEFDVGRQFRGKAPYINMVDERMKAYDDYVARGGQMTDVDHRNWMWIMDRK